MNYKISLFQSVRSQTPSTTDLSSILKSIKDGQYEELVTSIRNGGKRGKELKQKLPAFTVSGYCTGQRLMSNLKGYNSLIQLDYDDVDQPRELKEKLTKLQSTYCAFISPSGKGLKVFVHVLCNEKSHDITFKKVREVYDDFAQLDSDSSVSDILRLCFVSYDPDIYINADASPFEVYNDDTVSLESLFQFAKGQINFISGNRNNFTFFYSCLARDYGLQMIDVISFIESKSDSSFSRDEIARTVNSAYKYPSRVSKSMLNGVPVPKEGRFRQLVEQLSTNFVFMPEIECVFSRSGNKIDYSSIQTYADIRFALKDMKYSISKTDFYDMINISSIIKVSPLNLFQSEISSIAWDGRDRINELFQAMRIKNADELKLALFEKWLVTAYVFAMRGIDPKVPKKVFSRVALILHSHAKGLGKTEFFRKLGLSGYFQELTSIQGTEVYGELSGSFGDDERRTTSMMVKNLILNIDDIQELLINSSGELRSLISKDILTIRPLYGNSVKNLPRRSAICGSTNHGEILRNDDENRYLIFSLESQMNFSSINSIDFIQLWRQVAEVYYNNGTKSLFSNVDLDAIKEISNDFIYVSPEEELVREFFEYDGNPTQSFTFSDIRSIFSMANIRIPDQKLGSALRKLAPDHNIIRKNNGIRTYLVKKIRNW